MHKQIIRGFLSLFAFALTAHAVHAEKSATFTLYTPRYFLGDRMVATSPSFILGQRGTFTTLESFPSSTSFTVNGSDLPEGYGISKWVLSKSWGASMSGTTITSQTGGSSFVVTFDYKWEAKYGKSLDLTVYLAPITYTLSYNANGGDWTAGEPEGGTYEYNKTVTAPSADCIEHESYTLAGWKTNGGSLIAPGETFNGSDLGLVASGKVTLYAQWKAMKYNVELVLPEGASVKKNLTEYEYGKGATLPTATKDDGSKFEGWYDNPTFLGSPITKIGKYESGDLTFYAKFAMSIGFDGNGASSGTMASQSFSTGVPVTLSRNKFEKKYVITYNPNGGTLTGDKTDTAEYTFSHWNTKKDGTGDSYADGEYVTFNESKSVTLYAQWEPEEVKIILPTAPTPKQSTKSFSGWYTAQKGGYRVGGAGSEFTPDGTQTLYAQWGGSGTLAAAVGLTNAELTTWCEGGDRVWEVNDTQGSKKDKCLALGATQQTDKFSTVLSMNVTGSGQLNFSTKGFASKDYALKVVVVPGSEEHSVTGSGTDWVKQNVPIKTEGSIEVQWRVEAPHNIMYLDDVEWKPDSEEGTYTITTLASPNAGGTVTGGGTYKAGDAAVLTAKPKSSYKFIRWEDEKGTWGSRENPYEIKSVNANTTNVAVFASDYYYIAYNANGGSGTMEKQLVVRDEDTKLTANAFVRSGYTFAGWATAKDGAVAYADTANVRNLASKGQTKTLYAVWKSGSEPEPTPPGPTPTPEPEAVDHKCAVGEAVSVDLAADYPDQTIKSVSGLPTGLKFSAKTGLVTGTPTKAGVKTVTVKFADATSVKATWTVEALPAMMVGTYYGRAKVADAAAGQFQLKLTAAGKAAGYFYAAGKKISFTSTALVCKDDGRYMATVSYTYNRKKYADEIVLENAATVEGVDIWSATIGGTSEVLDAIDARRDTIKEVFGKAVSKTTTFDVEDETFAEGEYLKAKVTTAGVVTVSGKLLNEAGKLTSVSCSTHLVVANDGTAYCYITIYKTVSKQAPIVYDATWELP